jgi:hypothetical protein
MLVKTKLQEPSRFYPNSQRAHQSNHRILSSHRLKRIFKRFFFKYKLKRCLSPPRKLFRHQAAFSPPIDESAKLPRNKLSSMRYALSFSLFLFLTLSSRQNKALNNSSRSQLAGPKQTIPQGLSFSLSLSFTLSLSLSHTLFQTKQGRSSQDRAEEIC